MPKFFFCRVFLYQFFKRRKHGSQRCRDNTTKSFLVLGKISPFFRVFKLPLPVSSQLLWHMGEGGVATQKNRKKPVPNLKIAVAFGFFGFFRLFSVFFGFFRCFSFFFRFFFGFLWYFFGFFGLNFDKKFQSFKNHVNNEV